MARVQTSGSSSFTAVATAFTLFTVPAGVSFFLDFLNIETPQTALTTTQTIQLIAAGFMVLKLTLLQQTIPPIVFFKPLLLGTGTTIVLSSTLTPTTAVQWAFAGDQV